MPESSYGSRSYCGVLNIYKETGYTSSDVVARLRGILRFRKAGHTGTLDPDATGVLPVCLGKATKLCEFLSEDDKEYRAVCRLGITTDTQDISGTVLSSTSEEALAGISEEMLTEAVNGFLGEYEQLPPMYSAVKIKGKKLYEYARRGETVERTPRRVVIKEIRITGTDLPVFSMRVVCSKGTYIRTLCADIGEKLGVGAVMETLERTRSGRCCAQDAVLLDDLEKIMKENPSEIDRYIIPLDSFFTQYPALTAGESCMRKLLNGNPLPSGDLYPAAVDYPAGIFRIYDPEGNFMALYQLQEEQGYLVPYKMFV